MRYARPFKEDFSDEKEVILMPVPRDGAEVVFDGVRWRWDEEKGSWMYVERTE